MAIYEIETDQGVFEIEADREPTQEEALQAISGGVQPSQQPAQVSLDEFIRSQQAEPLDKIRTQASNLLNALVVQPIKSIGGVASGIAEEAGAASTVPGGFLPGGQFQRNLLQSGAEAGARTAFNLGDTIRNLVEQSAAQVATNPLGVAIRAASPVASAMMNLAPGTPSEQEIAQFVSDDLRRQQTNAVLSQPLLPEVIGTANLPLAGDIQTFTETVAPVLGEAGPLLRGAAAGIRRGARAVTSPIQTAREVVSAVAPTVGARIAPATMEDSIISSLNLSPDDIDAVVPKVPTAVERTLQVSGKVPQTAEEAIKAMKDARKSLYNERLEINNAAESQGLVVNGDEAVRQAEDVLNNLTTISEKQKSAILDDLKEVYSGEKKPSTGQKIQEDLNNEFSAAFANGTIDRANPAFQARLAIRDSVANQMDEIGQIVTGRAETPYSDIGNLIEVQGNLENTLNQLKVSKAAIKTGIKKVPGRLPGSKTEAATKITRGALTPFQKTQIEKLDDNVRRVFGEQTQRPPMLPIEEEIVNQLRSARSSAPISPEQSLEELIQQTIQDLPREMRGRNERAIAEAIVRSGQTSP